MGAGCMARVGAKKGPDGGKVGAFSTRAIRTGVNDEAPVLSRNVCREGPFPEGDRRAVMVRISPGCDIWAAQPFSHERRNLQRRCAVPCCKPSAPVVLQCSRGFSLAISAARMGRPAL